MTLDEWERLKAQLITDEGVKLYAYRDSLGFTTIGVGRLIDARAGGGITYEEAMYLFEHDVDRALRDLIAAFPWIADLSSARIAAFTNLAFNLGVTKLSKFVNTLAAAERGDWDGVERGLRNSLWFRQVSKSRSLRIIAMLKTGRFPDEQKA